MSNEFYDTWNTLSQQTLENWKKLGETNLKLSEKLLREQVDLTTALIETATTRAQEASATKDVKELASIQADLAQEYGKKVLETSRSCADIISEAGKVYNQLFETGVKAAGDNLAGAAKAASKTAKKAA